MKDKPYIISIGFLIFAIILAYAGLQKIIDQKAVIEVWYGPVSSTPHEVNVYHGIRAVFIGLSMISGGVIMATVAMILLELKRIRVGAFIIGISLLVITLTLFPPTSLTTNLKSQSFYSAAFFMLFWRIAQRNLRPLKSEELQSKVRNTFLGLVIISSLLSSIIGVPDVSIGLMSSLFIFGGFLVAYDILTNLNYKHS